MKQTTFASLAFDNKKKTTRREVFFGEMNKVVPWRELMALIEPYYPKVGNGRPPMSLERMLRIYCCQIWMNLSDPAAEDMLYDSGSVRAFVGIELGDDAIPDETTILKFRHLLETHKLAEQMFACINGKLETHGLMIKEGTIVDATIIAASPSTKNEKRERDPEMHQTKKGNQWHFGMKVHTGSETRLGLVHSLVTTPANVHDSQMMDDLMHGEETKVYGDSAYASAETKEIYETDGVRWRVTIKAKRGKKLTAREEQINTSRSRVRAKGEHPYRIVKHLWGHAKVRYRGLKKNTNLFFASFGLANLYMARRDILRLQEKYVW